jgi:transcriptional regulator with XRE-family HTH domain
MVNRTGQPMGSSDGRYCRCGNRLAAAGPGNRCASCERRDLQLRASPPEVEDEFWHTEQMRDALDVQHIGRVSRAYRRHPANVSRYGQYGIPQDLLGAWLGLTQAQISRIENGPPVRNLDSLAHWARTLKIPPGLLWFRLPDLMRQREADGQLAGLSLPSLARIPHLAGQGEAQAHDPDAAAMQAFRTADLRTGGGDLYPAVMDYLHDRIAPRLFGTLSGTSTRAAFTAAAGLTEMAGWMAHDAGHDIGQAALRTSAGARAHQR